MPHSLACLCLVFATAVSVVGQDQAAAEAKPADAAVKSAAEAKPSDSAPAVDEAKKDEAKKDEAKKDEAKKDEAKKDEAKKDEAKKDEAKKTMEPIGYTDTARLPGQPWRVHDLLRPRPRDVSPGIDSPAAPPSDAIVLFDGTDLSHWGHQDRNAPGQYVPARWTVKDGYMEAARGTGYLCSLDNVGSCQLHIEWASPEKVSGDGQGRGNSGIKFWGAFEVQVLDSFNNRTYADGQAGAVYGQYPPAVNATLPPGQWQAYDVIYEMPEFDSEGKLAKPAYLTIFHNGVLLHHHRELTGPTGRANSKYSDHPPGGSIMLQDHGNPVRYRNIWVRPL